MHYLKEVFADVNHCLLDCCNSIAVGSSNYKGNYSLPTTLEGNANEQGCTYSGRTSSAIASAQCQRNMEIGPSYDALNVTSCKAKYQTTNDLDNLNEVKKISFYSVRDNFILDLTEKR